MNGNVARFTPFAHRYTGSASQSSQMTDRDLISGSSLSAFPRGKPGLSDPDFRLLGIHTPAATRCASCTRSPAASAPMLVSTLAAELSFNPTMQALSINLSGLFQ